MKNKFFIILTYILIFFNSNLFSSENKILKVGLLAPLSGEYKDLGYSLLYTLQLALDEIDDSNIHIIPRDSGSNDKKKLNDSINDLISQDVKVVIGPIDHEDFEDVKKFDDLVFISLSNIRDNKIKVFSGNKWIYKNKEDTWHNRSLLLRHINQ